jgi:hypothetical protein
MVVIEGANLRPPERLNGARGRQKLSIFPARKFKGQAQFP